MCFRSICVFVAEEEGFCCHPDDAYVKPKAPMLYVPDVALYASLHLPELFGFSSESGDLRPSGDSWLDEMTYHEFVNES